MQDAKRKQVLIISPVEANANNGNGHTARRWAALLSRRYDVSIASAPAFTLPSVPPDLVIALHARRSAQALSVCAVAFPSVPRILVMTGTDLYRDIHTDPVAQNSLLLAQRLVVLQEAGVNELPPAMRSRAVVIYQSNDTEGPAHSAGRTGFTALMIGHLRAEKDPATFMRAAGLVEDARIRLQHIGAPLDTALAGQARATAQHAENYQWLGALAHADTLQRLSDADVLVLASVMEGGANVITEALQAGVPVLASDISGNRGMLGPDYAGYFPVGDAAGLARLISRAAHEPEFLARLKAQCAARLPLFAPAREQAALLELVDNCVHH